MPSCSLRPFVATALLVFGVSGSAHAKAQMEGPKRALIIGVNGYSQVTPLNHAESDAIHFFRMLTNPKVGTVSGANARVLSTDAAASPMAPTRSNILRALDSLASKPQRGGTLWFYFSGHGMELERYSQIVPADADLRKPIEEQVIPVSLVRDRLVQACPEGTIVIVLDACHSGSPNGVKMQEVLTLSLAGKATRAKVITVAAADINEAALEIPEPPGGIFTYFLVRGLTGEADANQDGYVGAGEAMEYTASRVRGLAARAQENHSQTPQFILGDAAEVALTRSSIPSLEQLESMTENAMLRPGSILPTGVLLALEGDRENILLRTFTTSLPDSEFRLVDPNAAETMKAVNSVLGSGPNPVRDSHVALGARYLAVLKATTTVQRYEQTSTVKCVASAVMQVFDETGRAIGAVQREASQAAFNESEATREALRQVAKLLAGTSSNSPLVDALRGIERP